VNTHFEYFDRRFGFMNFHTRKWVKPEDLNPNGTLFGGRLLEWIDEEAALYTIVQLENRHIVTKFMSEINFIQAPVQGDIIEMGIEVVAFGRSSITLRCEVRNKLNQQKVLEIDRIVMVNLGDDGKPTPHGKTQVEFVSDRLDSKDQ
jgi:acyl-CoA hydrolase